MDTDPPDKTWPYLAVTGRTHGDDEDSVLMYHAMTAGEAMAAFQADMLEQYLGDNPPDDGDDAAPVEIYVNYVLTSAAPIEIEINNC